MTNDKGILIKNIFYMLSYSFTVLKKDGYESVGSEEFDHAGDLFCEILNRGISQQLKQGLFKTYISKSEDLTTVRGKINLNRQIQNRIQKKQIIACEYDELSVNNLFNQILKTTSMYFLRDKSIKKDRKDTLRKLMLFFDEVDELPIKAIPWEQLMFQRNNRTYEMLINICRLAIEGYLQTTELGNLKMPLFSEEHMARLFESFVAEYYRTERKKYSQNVTVKSQSKLKWDTDETDDEATLRLLPNMYMDIELVGKNKTLIIDTKYYEQELTTGTGIDRFHTDNLYQIFSYVKNKEAQTTNEVSGMLLYARTQHSKLTEKREFTATGNKFYVRSLDLNTDFTVICEQLDGIVEEYFA